MATKAATRRWLGIAERLLAHPTATGFERQPADHVRDFARRRKGLSLVEDRYGNLVVKWPGRGGRRTPPLVLVAHLDHPGFVVDRVRGDRVELSFRGGVHLRCAKRGTPLRFFEPGSSEPIGKGVLVSASNRGARRETMLGAGVAAIVSGRAASPGYTMWDFPGWSVRGERIVGRCLDDLLGAAAALATLDEVHRRRPRGAHVWGLFTRAEEVGLLGALAAVKARTVPRDARVLSLETSAALPHAPQGGGVVVRVGDARSLFDPRLMGVLHDVAVELAGEGGDFRFQRRLMDGGSCEATAFCAAGYRAGGLALPLGNYHNMDRFAEKGGPRGIGAEHVLVADYAAEVELLVRLAERSHELARLERGTADWVRPLTKRAHELLTDEPLERTRE